MLYFYIAPYRLSVYAAQDNYVEDDLNVLKL